MSDQLTASAPPTVALSLPRDPAAATAELRALAERPLAADRRAHPGRWVLSAVVLAAVAWLLYKIASNNQIGWSVTGHYLFSGAILRGLLVTLELTAVGQAVAIVVGVLLAACGEAHNPVLAALARAYIWFFRSVPLIVQILAWYNLAIVFPTLALGIPGTSWHVQGSTNTIVTPFLASVLALGLAEAAYMAEIVRAGIVSVARGQVDAGLSLGLTQRQTMRRIVLPQTLRVVVPPTGNQLIGLVKACALVSVIGGDELLTSAQRIYSVNFRIIALLLDVTIWYLVLTSVLTVGQHYLERWLDRESLGGDRGSGSHGPSLTSRWRKNLGPRRSPLGLSQPDFDQEVSL
jgi:polar amino acid transport system permease protein